MEAYGKAIGFKRLLISLNCKGKGTSCSGKKKARFGLQAFSKGF